MHRPSTRTVSEIVAVVSVVLGLLFVGIEIRNNTAVARAEARRELAQQNIDFLMQVVLDDDLNELWSEYWSHEWFEGLSPADRSRASNLAVALILRLENVFLQFKDGVLEEGSLPNYGMLQPKTKQPWFEAQWNAVKALRDPDFVRYFDRVHAYAP